MINKLMESSCVCIAEGVPGGFAALSVRPAGAGNAGNDQKDQRGAEGQGGGVMPPALSNLASIISTTTC